MSTMKPVRFLWRIFENVPYHTAHTVLIKHASAHPLADVITSLGDRWIRIYEGCSGIVPCIVSSIISDSNLNIWEGCFKSIFYTIVIDLDRDILCMIKLILSMKFKTVFKYRFVHHLWSKFKYLDFKSITLRGSFLAIRLILLTIIFIDIIIIFIIGMFLSCDSNLYFWKYFNALVEDLKIFRIKFILLIELVQYCCFYINLVDIFKAVWNIIEIIICYFEI